MLLEKRCFVPEVAFNRRQIKYLILKENILIITNKNQQLLGQITVLRRHYFQYNILRIYNIVVYPDFQKQGIGTILLKAGFLYFINDQTKYVSLEVEEYNPAVKLYQQFGFVIQRFLPSYYGKNKNGFRMVYNIENNLSSNE